MAYTPKNANGQATMANSAPVVIASNQTSIPVSSTPATTGQNTMANSTSVAVASDQTLSTVIAITATNNSLVSSKTICSASTNATSIKASAGKIYRIDAFNSDTIGYWLKFYNKASAPTVGTDTPVATKYVPPGGGFVIESTVGIPYTTGIALATTLLATDADTTVVTNANKLVINLRYI